MQRHMLTALVIALAITVGSVTAQDIFTSKDGVTLPVAVRTVKPGYTSAALDAGIEGKVLMDVVVLADGTVGDVTVIESLDKEYGLDAQAVGAARQWEFKPGTKDGKPVAVRVALETWFTLK
jgi:periplasmic protein TonB